MKANTPDKKEDRTKKTVAQICNRSSAPLKFSLEPWAQESEIPVGDCFLIAALEPPGGFIEVTFTEGGVTVWPSGGTLVRVFHNAKLTINADIPFPPTPVEVDYDAWLSELWKT